MADAVDEDADCASIQALGKVRSAGASPGSGESSASTSEGCVGMGKKPVQQTSLWNRWLSSDPPKYDAGVRAGWCGGWP